MSAPLELRAGDNGLALWRAVRGGAAVRLAAACWPRVEAGHRAIREAATGERAVYGLNTGFGKLALVRIPADRLAELQVNLVRSHQRAWASPCPLPSTRLDMAL